MAEKKYEGLVKTLTFMKGLAEARANARQMTFNMDKDLAGIDMNFILGVYDHPGDWAPQRGSHTHPFEEYLLFFGYDPDDMGYLGSELELFMGEEWEPHIMTRPTIAVAPKEFPHCPLITKKVEKPFGHLHLAMSGRYSGGQGPEEPEKPLTDGTKYDYLFKEMTVEKGPGGADAVQMLSFSGEDRKDYFINMQMGLYARPGRWSQEKHTHPYDEIMVFFGHNTDDLSCLGAEITIELGEEGEEYTFDVPTVVSIPKGTAHFPVTCNKLEKPYRMARVGLAPNYHSDPVR